jgi:molecular chaperone GrpE
MSTQQTPNNQTSGDGAPLPGTTAEAEANKVLQDLETLRKQLQTAEQARDQNLAQALRAKADFENYQKRMQRDLAVERRYAAGLLASDLLGVLDNLERATAAAKKAGETGSLVQGVAMVHTQFLDALRRHGITRMEAEGKPFDPMQHQAVMEQPSADHPPMTVVAVLEPGYQLHDRVLRPARVAVSTAPAKDEPGSGPQS